MNTATLAIGLILLMAAVATAYVHAARRRQRKAVADSHRIAHAVKDYFARSGAQISAQCLSVQGRFLVLVESEPLKRFRYSHIVEASLIGHVEKALGLHVERVFWRFPLPVGASSAQDTADLKPDRRDDEYVTQGIRAAQTNPDYHVAEDSWDQFERARQVEAAALPPPPVEDGKNDRDR
ncbi:MAG: hypothetical protein HZC23_04560 [Rhodocyclales bacterium]|nr:hypothetical protein [Rhodocyclales bacterium]